MLTLLAILLCLLCCAAEAQTPKVRYSLAVYQPGTTTRLTSVHPGNEFDLALCVQDVRPAGTYVSPQTGNLADKLRGVWAAYADVQFNRNAVHPKTTALGSATFSRPYINGKKAVDHNLGIGPLGAFDGFDDIGSDMLEVVRVRMVAAWPPGVAGSVQKITAGFGLRFDTLQHPAYDTLVLGNIAADPPEQSDVATSEIVSSGVTLTIVK